MTHLPLLVAIAGVAGMVAVAAPSPAHHSTPSSPVTSAAAAASRTDGSPADKAWLQNFGRYNLRKGTINLFQKPDGC